MNITEQDSPDGTEQIPVDGPDSRTARREAIIAGLLWLSALLITVGLSTFLGDQVMSFHGIPRWAAIGIFSPWLLFFLLHCRYSLGRRKRFPGNT